MLGTIDVTAKGDTLILQLAIARERKHLKPSTIGQNGTVPTIEFVQTSGFFYNVHAWTQVEMIGVAQNDLSLHIIFEFGHVHSFYSSHCAHRHENGSFNLAMIGFD